MRTLAAALVVGLAVAAGCSSFPKPEARAASSAGAIRGAEEAGASSVPQAALHLKLAQEERDKGMALMRSGEYERAHYMLMRSEADAELANAISREMQARSDADQAKQRLDDLKKKAGEQ